MPKEKKGRTPRVSKGVKDENKLVAKIEEQPQCYIHDKVYESEVVSIHANVCVNDEPLTEFEGKHYCLFHLPSKEKDDKGKFEEKFRARLKKIEESIAAFKELTEAEQAKSEDKLFYDFRYVWFPSDVNLQNYKFTSDAYFSSAVFTAVVGFDSATFTAVADFSSATFTAAAYFGSAAFRSFTGFDWAIFMSSADFNFSTFTAAAHFKSTTFTSTAHFNSATFTSIAAFRLTKFMSIADFVLATFTSGARFSLATFTSGAYFRLATFTSDAYFNSTTFTSDAYFNSTTFMADADFRAATFSSDAYFKRAKFGKKGNTYFDEVNFDKDTFFDRTRFRNDVSFNSAVFGSESYVIFREAFFARKAGFSSCTAEGYLIFTTLRQGRESSFDLQNAAFEKATRVSFHTIDLCPGWFVNVDSRKFVFTDIFWKHLDWDSRNKKLQLEIASLEERGIKDQRKRLFEIAARQLAVNAEENNRYEEAAKFRYMAMETKRLEETKHRSSSRYLFWLYKWSSGYGESWTRAALVLSAVIVFFGILYTLPISSFIYDEKQIHAMNAGEGLVHSLYITAFQRPEPKAADTLTRFLIILETIFAPVQAALLALAIRRKFMR